MLESSKKILDALKQADMYCEFDIADDKERVYTGCKCDVDGKELHALISFITDSSDMTVSMIYFSFDGVNIIEFSDETKGIKVCNKLNNYINLIYTFGINDQDHSLFAKCVFPPGMDKGKLAALLTGFFIHSFKEKICYEIAECI